MELNYEIDVKTRRGSYKTYRKTFDNRKHFDNWCSAMVGKWGNKIIGESQIN